MYSQCNWDLIFYFFSNAGTRTHVRVGKEICMKLSCLPLAAHDNERESVASDFFVVVVLRGFKSHFSWPVKVFVFTRVLQTKRGEEGKR